MRSLLVFIILMFAPEFALADVVVASRNIRNHTIISMADLKLVDGDVSGGFEFAEDIVGMEARAVLYAGRPILLNDVGPPALIERNQIVTLHYQAGPLAIAAEGRSLSRGGLGDRLRVMNLSSRSTVTGWVQADGSVMVSNSQARPN